MRKTIVKNIPEIFNLVLKIESRILWTCEYYCFIIINNFWGDLSDVSAETKCLVFDPRIPKLLQDSCLIEWTHVNYDVHQGDVSR